MNTAASVTIVLVFILFKIQSLECMETMTLNFEAVAKTKYFVDKSDLLKEILHNTTERTTWIITFPKRFGKTTNMHMIRKFVEIEVNADGLIIAQDFKNVTDTPSYKFFNQKYNFGYFNITNDSDFMREHFGRYPVIHMDFRGVHPRLTYERVIEICRYKIHEAFLQHLYLRYSKNLNDIQKETVELWIHMSERTQLLDMVENGLKQLLEILYKHFNRPVIVLIDEYDAMIQSYLLGQEIENDELERIISPFINMLSYALKDQDKLRVALLTGVTYISSAGFTDNLPIQKHRFGRENTFWKYYGFTSEELDRLFSISQFINNSTIKNQVERYYDGYLVNNMLIYTPTSIIQFFTNEKLAPYWNMQTYGIISEFWKTLRIVEIRIKVSKLIRNQSVTIENLLNVKVENIKLLKHILETSSLKADITGKATKIFFNFLLDLGYMKITWQNDTHLNVTIPNMEIRTDIINLLDEYKSGAHTDEEFILQAKLCHHLQSITADDHTHHLQEITNVLNELARPFMSLYPVVKEDNLKDMLKSAFIIQRIHYHTEVSVKKTWPVDKKGHDGSVDLLVINFENVYVIIETKYDGKSSAALNQTNQNVSVRDHPYYKQTQNCVLQLGINMRGHYEITVSALLNVTNGESYGPYHFTSATTSTLNDYYNGYVLKKTMPLKKMKTPALLNKTMPLKDIKKSRLHIHSTFKKPR